MWLPVTRKARAAEAVVYDDAVEVALCYGWIDGQAKRGGDGYYLQRFTPRSKRSNWSQRNRDKALALIGRGEMRPAGLAEIERAKQDGRWPLAEAG